MQMRFAHRFLAAISIIVFTNLTACSFASPPNQNITISPSHPRAEVSVDGRVIGRGTQQVNLSKRREHSVLAKCGNSSGVAYIGRDVSGTGFADMIGGFIFLLPFLGFFSPGAFELSPSNVYVAIPDDSECDRE